MALEVMQSQKIKLVGIQRGCLLYMFAISGSLRCFSFFPIIFLKDGLELKTNFFIPKEEGKD